MLPGPNLDVLTGSLAVGARVYVQRGKTVTVTDLPVADVVVDATTSRNVRRQISFTTTSDFIPSAPLDRLNNYGHRIHAFQVFQDSTGSQFEVDLGWFLVTDWDENTDAGTMSVQAVDLLQLVEDDVAAWPSSPPKNQRLGAEVQRLAGSTLAVQYTGPNTLVDPELQFQTDRLSNLADLCAAYGLEYRMRPDGFLHVFPLTSEIVETYARDLLLDAPRESADRKPNRWLAVGSKSETKNKETVETRWSFEAKATAEPYDSAYGIVRDRIEVQSATNQSMVTRAANDAMKQAISVIGFRSFEIVPDPRLELGDNAIFNTAHGPVVGRDIATSLPVDDPDARMRVDVEIIG